MKLLKGIAANLCFILGAVLVLLPIGALSWLLERAAQGLDALGRAISAHLPQPRQVFSDTFTYWFWQVVWAGFFVWFLLATLVNMYTGHTWDMLRSLVMMMVEAIWITRTWEQRHAH